MKRMEVTEVHIADHNFYLRPLPAFTATNIFGELATLIVPLISALAPLAGRSGENGEAGNGNTENGETGNLTDINVEDALPAISKAFTAIGGNKFEAVVKRLTIDTKTISVEGEATDGKTVQLSKDLVDEIFCQDVLGLLTLCWEVLKLNYSGFFEKFNLRSGNLDTVLQQMTET